MNSLSTNSTCNNKDFTQSNNPLAIIVIGASGDLAKRKTYPSLFSLFEQRLFPANTIIYGYGRSNLTHESLRKQISPFISYDESLDGPNQMVVNFLGMCYYQRGKGYDDADSFLSMHKSIARYYYESNVKSHEGINCLVYMATPPNVFSTATKSITQSFVNPDPTMCRGIPSESIRILFEKPFGSDTQSYIQLSNSLSKLVKEQQIYRIDHYLGKDMIRCIPSFRFNNSWARAIWSRKHISHVIISVKESIGTDGRGGYFDQYGIIRDIMQNHLLQVLCLVAMEEPTGVAITNDSPSMSYSGVEAMRDAKCNVLKSIVIPDSNDCIVGQYEGYKNEDMVRKDSRTPTFAAVKLFVDNERWRGVPFLLLAGKALEDKSAEVKVVFRHPNAFKYFDRQRGKSELKIRIQPDNYISLTTNVQEGDSLSSDSDHNGQSSTCMKLDLSTVATPSLSDPRKQNTKDDAYSKLIYDALRGIPSSFVRDDELRLSWQIFTPLLHQLESVNPFPYKYGSRGPQQTEKLLLSIENISSIGTSEQSKL
jgi:glucose-6-phosphate 1-dehydrogenase